MKTTLYEMNTQIHIFHQEACSLMNIMLMKIIKQIINNISSVTGSFYM